MSSPMQAASRLRLARRGALALVTLAATIAVAACATSSALRNGQKAEIAADFDRAVIEYTRAAQEKPNDRDVTLALDRAKLRAAEDALLSRTTPRRDRQARRSPERAPDRGRAQSHERRHRKPSCARTRTAAAEQDRGFGRREDAARVAGRPHARRGAGRACRCRKTSSCRRRSSSAKPVRATSSSRWPATATSTSCSIRRSGKRR